MSCPTVSFDIYSVPRSPGGRRQFRNSDKIELLEEAERGGVRGIIEVAARYGLSTCQLYEWRRAYRWGKLKRSEFVPVWPSGEAKPRDVAPVRGKFRLALGQDGKVRVSFEIVHEHLRDFLMEVLRP